MGYMIEVEISCPNCREKVKFLVGTNLKGSCPKCEISRTLDELLTLKQAELQWAEAWA